MTAGSGILHEEMMPAVPHLYGVQLWLNLAKKDKMAPPDYVHIASESIPEVSLDQGKLRVLAGSYDGQQGFQSHYQPVQYYDLQLDPQGTFTLPVQSGDSITLFALRGAVQVENETLPHFHAAALTQGDQIHFANPSEESISVLVFMSERIDEPIAWRPGPIVMNTEEELDIAYREVEEGTFLKDNMPMHRS